MWIKDGSEFKSEDINDYTSFVYLVEDKITGQKYCGKKQFFSTKTLKPLKGQTRKRKVKIESDWFHYCGSNSTIKAIQDEHGIERFNRTILHLCHTKSEASYLEIKEQLLRNVCFDPTYLNGIINVRINAKHLAKLDAAKLRFN